MLPNYIYVNLINFCHGEPTEYVQSKAGSPDEPSLKIVDYSDHIGRSFLLDTNKDGERLRVRVKEIVDARTTNTPLSRHATTLDLRSLAVHDEYSDCVTNRTNHNS